jgi:putative oxidoreductase
MKRALTIELISFLLILLFVYTTLSKLLDFQRFKSQMNSQTLPLGMSTVLIWTLPGIELIIVAMLSIKKTLYAGLGLSFILMMLFTGYVGLVLAGYYSRVPCSCGGVLKGMGWQIHFLFNIFFMLLSLLGIYLLNRERRTGNSEL